MFAIGIVTLLLAIAAARIASQRFHSSKKYCSRVTVPGARTARDAMSKFLRDSGVSDVKIVEHTSYITNYFDTKRRTLYFSPEVLNSDSVYAWSIGLHEAAHALQTGESLKPLIWRQSNIQLSRYLPTALGIVCLLLTLLKRMPSRTGLMIFGIILALLMLANLMSSPIENNASKRAFNWLEKQFSSSDKLLDTFRIALMGAAWRDTATILKSPTYTLMGFLPLAAKPRPY